MLALMSTIAHVARTLRTQASNWWGADATAREAEAAAPLPDAPVAVFFAGGQVEFYKLAEWLPVLEHLHESIPLVVVGTRADGARAAMGRTHLPVRLAKGAPALERLVRDGGVRGVLYVNHLERNFRMLRFHQPVHVYLGHGESDKDSSISNQNKAYDFSFVAGQAARDRLARVLRHYDADARAVLVGRPQLDHDPLPPAGFGPDPRITVLYAPTWEGDRAAMAYGSVATHGDALVGSLVRDGGFRVVYRPHPRAGTTSSAYRAADARVRALLGEGGHVIDDGAYGWQRRAADVCVTDVSSVAVDWLATGKPLLVTIPAAPGVTLPASRLLDLAPRVTAAHAGGAPALVRAALTAMPEGWGALVEYYVGDTTPGAATTRFQDAVRSVLPG
jgi:hypothetical protein